MGSEEGEIKEALWIFARTFAFYGAIMLLVRSVVCILAYGG